MRTFRGNIPEKNHCQLFFSGQKKSSEKSAQVVRFFPFFLHQRDVSVEAYRWWAYVQNRSIACHETSQKQSAQFALEHTPASRAAVLTAGPGHLDRLS
jgi:hypothetical protein